METAEKYHVKVILKTMDLLKCFSPQKPEWTVNELTTKLKINRTTVFRILTTLASGGFVQLNPKNGGYRLGSTLVGLSMALFNSMDIRAAARDMLKELAMKTGESVHITIWYDNQVMVMEQWESPSEIKVSVPLGKKMAAHCTATGKIFLSGLPEEELTKYLAEHKLKSFTPNTIVSEKLLKQELKKTRQLQIGFDFEEYSLDVVACAAPVYSFDESVHYAIAVIGPSRRMESKIVELTSMVKEAANKLSHELGYKPTSDHL